MKSLRTFAAQSEHRKRITQASIGGTMLFCLSLGMPSAMADDVTLNSLTNASEQPQSLSSSLDATSSTLNTSDTQLSQQDQTSQTISPTQPSLTSVSNQIDTAQSTLQTAVSNATDILNTAPGAPDSISNSSAAMEVVQNAGTVIQAAMSAIQDAQTALVSAQSAAAVIPYVQSTVDGATVTVQMKQVVLTDAVSATVAAQTAVDITQANVDGATATVATDTTNLVTAQAAADASTVVGTITASGLIAQVYQAAGGSSPALPSDDAVPVLTTAVPYISFNWGSGQLLNSGLYDHVIIKFTGQITADSNMSTIKYAVYSDDGAQLYIDGNLVVNNWRDQGLRWSSYSAPIDVSTNKTQNITLWYYENGGGAGVTLGWMVNNAYFTSPTDQNFSHTTTGATQDPVLVAAAQAAQATLVADTAALADAQIALSAAQDALNSAQQDQAAAQADYDAVLAQLTNAQSVMQVAQATAASALAAAAASADTATAAVDTATTVVTDAANTVVKMLTPVPTPPAPTPRPVPQPAPVPVPDPAPQPAPEPQPQPEPVPVPQPAPEPAPAPQPVPVPVPAPVPIPAPVPVTPAPAPQPPVVVPGLVSNSPDQLSDTTPKEAPAEVLVPHVQEDKAGVENGGIEFFGTKSAPQVVGEDGKLTPPAPPPGSGLPIPPEAITVAATFIGQPGGTTFNAPDVAIPVVETPVTGALAAVPGAQALNHAFVAMANIGNDMSPVTRKKAKKILVLTTVIAAVRRKFGN